MIHDLQFNFLKKYYHIDVSGAVSENRLPLERIFIDGFSEKVKDKFVIDFGCGHGDDTEKMANWGAKLSLGLEIRSELVANNQARINLDNCQFATELPSDLKSKADMIISIDAFEHFDSPKEILQIMYDCLRPGGEAYISFGPTWYHPHGGHAFSMFPWAHLIFTEKSLIRWRNQFYNDGATKFNEVAGGLNQLSISDFEKIFQKSPFEVLEIDCKPIRGKKWLQRILGKEFTTSMVLAHLKKPLTDKP